MLTFIVVLGLFSMPVIAWVFARVWTLCGYLWCLSIYPERVDRFIYSKALPYLADDMSMAAGQMEFIEVWLASAIILETFFLLMIFLFRDKFRDDP